MEKLSIRIKKRWYETDKRNKHLVISKKKKKDSS